MTTICGATIANKPSNMTYPSFQCCKCISIVIKYLPEYTLRSKIPIVVVVPAVNTITTYRYCPVTTDTHGRSRYLLARTGLDIDVHTDICLRTACVTSVYLVSLTRTCITYSTAWATTRILVGRRTENTFERILAQETSINNYIHGAAIHDDVIKWKHFPRYWPFVRGIHRSPVNSPHTGQWRGALVFSLICAWINGWVNTREAGDLRRQRAHYDVTVMYTPRTLQDVITFLCHALDTRAPSQCKDAVLPV